MAKPKAILKPFKLYQSIVKHLQIQGIHPNLMNVQLVVSELTSKFVKTPYLVDDISFYNLVDTIRAIEKHNWFTEFQYLLAKSNKKNLFDVTKYVTQELKEAPGEI